MSGEIEISIHIDGAEKTAPDVGDKCERSDCPGYEGREQGFGLGGGGFGVYEFCAVCRRIVNKTITE